MRNRSIRSVLGAGLLAACCVTALAQSPSAPDAVNEPAAHGAWWTPRDAGLFGGIGGSAVGLLGAAIGTLSGLGRARRLAKTLMGLLLLTGIVALIGAGAALVNRQPYHVWYPLLLPGFLCTLLSLCVWPGVRARYAALELRKMQARDQRAEPA